MAKEIETKAPEEILLRSPDEKVESKPESKAKRDPFYNKEVNIKLNLRAISRVAIVVLLIMGVFMLGRLSTGSDFGLSGLVTADTSVDEPVVEEEKEAPKEEVKEEVKVEAPKDEPEPPKKEDTSDEETVTEYNNVKLTLEKAEFKWMETWGKMSELHVTLVNNEDGTIEPNSLMMSVKGYPDFEKEVMMPADFLSVRSKKGYSSVLPIKGGFAYSKADAGDLTAVQVSLRLLDVKGNAIATTTNAIDISG